jgi:hypothetical protein
MDQQEPQSGAPTQAPQGEKKDYTKWIVIGVVVLVVLYALQYMFSPARMAERMIERAVEESGGEVDIDITPMAGGDANITIKGEDGETYEVNAGGNVSLPDTWPKSVPLMSGAKLTYAQTVSAAQGGGISIGYTTDASVPAVIDYYTTELPKNGWTIALTSTSADGAMVSATRGEDQNEGVMVFVGSSSEGTNVTMTVQASE